MAEEVLSGIRTVFAFGGEKVEIERYNSKLLKAKDVVRVNGIFNGLANGTMVLLMVGINVVAFSFGVQFVLDDRSEVNKEFTPVILLIVCRHTTTNPFILTQQSEQIENMIFIYRPTFV